MGAIYLDAVSASSLLGISRRQFERKYVTTGRVRVLRFARSEKRKSARHIYLRADVEKLK